MAIHVAEQLIRPMREYFQGALRRRLAHTSLHPNGFPVGLESAIDHHVGYDFGHNQEDRKDGNRNLEGFFAFFFRS
jgi:hypothetical protein